MARLTESQRRRMRDEAARRKRNRLSPLSDAEMAAFLNVTYSPSTWSSDCGGYDGSTGSCDTGSSSSYSSPSYDPGSSSCGSSDPSTSSCGGGGGCD